jgi:predicted nucleic acid-binding protein
MKILIDTNIALDILLNRIDFYNGSAGVFVMAEKKIINGYITASAITDIFYIAQKQLGKKTVKEAIKRMLNVFSPATVTDDNIYQALDLEWEDFEDSVQFIVGEGLSVDYIVTRNTKDFITNIQSDSSITAVTPEQFIKIITQK